MLQTLKNNGVILNLFAVGVLWGITNPLIKKGTVGLEKVKRDTTFKQALAEAYFLATNMKYIVPFLINQTGSLLYYMSLHKADLSLAVPFTNALAFLFTAIGGWALGERSPSKNTILGMGLIVAGIGCYVIDNLISSSDP